MSQVKTLNSVEGPRTADRFLPVVADAARWLVFAVGAAYVVAYLAIAFARIAYPYELEWLEGSSVNFVRAILQERLYAKPSLHLIACGYTPFYYTVCAGVCSVFGLGLVPLRAVSLAASLGCFALLFEMARRESGSRFAGFLAVALFAATFRAGGAWLDIARLDSLFLLLLLCGFYVIRFHGNTWKGHLLSAVLFTLAFQTKQTTLVIVAPMVLYAFLFMPRRALVLLGGLVALIGGSVWCLDRLYDGWYNYYVFFTPSQHTIRWRFFSEFWYGDLLPKVPVMLAALVLYLMLQQCKKEWSGFFYFGAFAAGMIGGSWGSRMYDGAYDNVLIPAYAALALICALFAREALGSAAQWAERLGMRRPTVYALLLLQFALLAYHPLRQVPTRRDREAGDRFIAWLRTAPGEVVVPFHEYLPMLAGRPSQAAAINISDTFRAGPDDPNVKALLEELRDAIKGQRYSYLVLDNTCSSAVRQQIEPYYRLQEQFFRTPGVFFPVTGAYTRPSDVYVPRQ